jgi:CheY-like chemotaxis protein
MSASTRIKPRATDKPLVVLFAEDDRSHARLVLRGLEAAPPPKQIVHVRDGRSTLDYLRRQGHYRAEADSPRPNLIILDLRLPMVDGFEVLEQIKSTEELTEIPVVVLSTSAAESDISRAYQLHANSYIVKPDDYEAFLRLMDDLARYWLDWNKTT